MKYQFYRTQCKPIIFGNAYKEEKVTDEQVVETFGRDSGVIPQKLGATIIKNHRKTGKWYKTLTYHWRVEEVE